MFQYERIARDLRERIIQGDYPTGRLPAERALSEEFGVQRDTVRSALDFLVRSGVLQRNATRGTCIAPDFLQRGEMLSDQKDETPRKGSVLLVARTLEDTPVSATIFRGLSNCLGSEGIPVYWHEPEEAEIRGGTARRLDYLPSDELLAERNIRGLAIWPRSWTPLDRLRKLRETMPVVIVDRRMPGFEADFVGNRDFDSGLTVTRHLISLGHRRIGYLSGESWATTVQQRVAGYVAALEEAFGDHSPIPRVLHQDGGSRCLAPAMLETFLAGDGDPLTAVACANDIMAARLIHFVRSLGKRVPQDVAVTGSGNLLPVMMDAFGLTTFAAPIEELGWAAGEMLLDRMRGKAGPGIRELEIPMQLIVRESCGSQIKIPRSEF